MLLLRLICMYIEWRMYSKYFFIKRALKILKFSLSSSASQTTLCERIPFTDCWHRSLWRSLLGSLASNQQKKKTRKQISSVCLSDYLGTYLGFIILSVPEYALPKISSNSTVSLLNSLTSYLVWFSYSCDFTSKFPSFSISNFGE